MNQENRLSDHGAKVRQCRACSLRDGCQQVVYGEGPATAKLMLIGEGPGADEDRLGRPFVGAAGQLLDRILAAGRFDRADVYIANIVKCRPPGNRLPSPNEVQACLPHLQEQIALINPQWILCLGALATKTLIDPKAMITKVRGQWVNKEGRWYLPTFHPAALLRDPAKKRPVWEDIQKLMAVVHDGQAPQPR
ncbi:uracil-DNA glycosylase [Heliophilum fasciatum]|uniref:Type-4 uracil-DNA glycosylase n=1 Tax=Heliophilum fasciatum TaxID=35700 RepID=A0A4V2SY72_9FIRM|nr:uracil-DNA glycosylase [Heliophilum fasciatum]MCW2276703.1 DNA polymerase [Heliophilum fasciatum]TCP68916.1 DNA polymerase [Heliophilum fasciatum]